MNQEKTPLFDAVKKFADWNPVPFFVPSHKMGEGSDPGFKSFSGENLFKIDLSEVRWTDDFHSAYSSIKEAQELAADAWGAVQSHFLVNGTSGGIIAAISSVCGEGDRIIIPRNAHKSAIYGLVVSGAEPVYVMPDVYDELGLIGGFSPEALERAFEENPDAKAVFTVSPTYHGVISDTASLAEIAHRHGAALIADEAHGNHMYFSERLPKGALELGADIVCQSTHKMSGSLTQSSILHLGKDATRYVDFDKIRANLSLIQTTSPSYVLLASLDTARSYIATKGESLLGEVLSNLEKAREDISQLPGIEVLGVGQEYRDEKIALEPTRLVISARALGIDGYEIFRVLRENYDIECEFADPVWCICVAGLGTKAEHANALTKALKEISQKGTSLLCACNEKEDSVLPLIPHQHLTPRKAWFAKKEKIPFEESLGRVSAEMVVPYPPGIPVLCPGEVVSNEVYEYLSAQKRAGRHMHCAAGDGLETLNVLSDFE